MELEQRIQQQFGHSIETKIAAADRLPSVIAQAGICMAQSLLNSGKILICGNGGSAADAQHFAAELVNRFETERPNLAAISLSTDSSALTSIANDYDFSQVYSRQILALGNEGDVLLAISTSGNSENILQAVLTAQQRKLKIITLTGKGGGRMRDVMAEQDIEICVPAEKTSRIQETHILVIHCLCDAIDYQLFIQDKGEPAA